MEKKNYLEMQNKKISIKIRLIAVNDGEFGINCVFKKNVFFVFGLNSSPLSGLFVADITGVPSEPSTDQNGDG